MKIRDVIEGRYRLFDQMSEENKLKNIEAVCHIQFLMATSRIDAGHWDLQEVFGTGEGNQVHVLKNEINRRFFEYAKLEGTSTHPALESISEAIRKKMDLACRDFKVRARRQARDAVTNERNSIQALSNRMDQCRARMSQALQTLADLDSKDLGISHQISKALESGFFTVHEYDGEYILSLLTQPVTLFVKNLAQALDLRFSMGRYRVLVDLRTQLIRVWMHENNLCVNGVYHPYVSSGGALCFGGAAAIYQQATQDYQIGTQLELIEALLKSYTQDSSPYMHLNQFTAALAYNRPEHHKRYTIGTCDECHNFLGQADSTGCKCPTNPHHGNQKQEALPIETCGNCDNELSECNCDQPEEYDEERASL